MEVSSLCRYLSFFFVSYCVDQTPLSTQRKRGTDNFEVIYEWNYVNFTWPTAEDYNLATITGRYVPANNVMAGIKFYKDKLYIALPRLQPGTPVTLAVMQNTRKNEHNPLLRPFPSWKMNTLNNCAGLQSVHSFEIDKSGVMWVLDGNRITNITRCPPKIILMDLKNRGSILQYMEFPEAISSRRDGFLNDLVIDETDGGFAYITENSDHDPGLIVYSRLQNKAWKLRDRSMFAEILASNFAVAGIQNNKLINIDGIALSPVPKDRNQERLVYYSSLSGYNLFAVSNRILKNEAFTRRDSWRRSIKYIGTKEGQTDGMMIDNEGNMYYGLLNLYGIGKWNIFDPYITSKVIDQDSKQFIWPDSFGMDNSGHLYILSSSINRFTQPFPPVDSDVPIFRISALYTGTKSYLYTRAG